MKVEPPADMREMALIHFQMFRAYVDAGFSEAQALNLIRQRVTLNLVLGTLTVAVATLGLAY